MAVTDYGAQPWGSSDDIEEFRRQTARFCGRVVALSTENPPPGVNAASGGFRDKIIQDTELAGLVPPRNVADDPEAESIFQIISSFEQGLRGAFGPENYESRWTKSGALAFKGLENLRSEIGNIVASIGRAVALDPKALGDLVVSVQALVDRIHGLGIKFEGKHANGWIQKNVKAVAQALKAQIAPFAQSAQDPMVKEVAKALQAIADGLIAIPDFKNDPWLYGEWQIQFQAIMGAGEKALLGAKPK